MSAAEAAATSPGILRLTIRFLSLGRPYALRIVLTILVCFVASGAKAGQAFILKPVIDLAQAKGNVVEVLK